MSIYSQRGVTIWELLTTLLVVGIILGLGVPNFMEFERSSAMTAAANELLTGLMTARTEAIKRQVPVTLCASANPTAAAPTCSPTGAGANGGFIVWGDENGNVDANGSPILTDATDGNHVVDAGETILLQRAAPGGKINVWADLGYITYGPSGFPFKNTVVHVNDILLCDDRGNRTAAAGNSTARLIRVASTGRAQVLRNINEVSAGLATITAAGVAAACP